MYNIHTVDDSKRDVNLLKFTLVIAVTDLMFMYFNFLFT